MKAEAFLFGKRPLADKITEFRQSLVETDPLFAEFVIAEHYLKDGNRDEALKTYQKCLSFDAHLQKERWLVIQVKSRLYELAKEDSREETSPSVKDEKLQ